MPRSARVFRISANSPDDVSGIQRLIQNCELDAQNIRAILGKTEGNGCVNDFTRGFATQSIRGLLSNYLDAQQISRIPLIMSGGTEGGLSPHWIVLGSVEEQGLSINPSLALACAFTRPLQPDEIGRSMQVELVCAAVQEAMKMADIDCVDDVHYVQIKCPLLTPKRINAVGGDVATSDTLKSMGLSRGASALGVAKALGEIASASDNQIGSDLSLWSSRASCSAGIELMCCEIVVLGESAGWCGPMRIGHTVMRDAIDSVSVVDLLATLSASASDGDQLVAAGLNDLAEALQLTHKFAEKHLVATLAKAEASSSGRIRNSRHTMLQDSNVSSTRHARGFVGGMLAGLLGHTELFISGGAEHQGPDGGGPVAFIYSSQS